MIDLAMSPLRNAGWIHPQTLARSAQPSLVGYAWVRSAGFNGIIDLRKEAHLTPPMDFYSPTPSDPGPGRSVLSLPTDDHEPVAPDDITRARGFLSDPRNLPCLIFCGEGSGRTGHLAAMIRLQDDHWSLERVKKEALSYRVPRWLYRLICFFSGGEVGWLDDDQITAVEVEQAVRARR